MGIFMDTADLAIIVRAAKHLRIKRMDLNMAREKLAAWREETLECVSFEQYLADEQKKPAGEGSAK